MVTSALIVIITFSRRKDTDGNTTIGVLLTVLAVAVGAVMPVIWLLLDNISGSMVLANNDTKIVTLVFIVHAALVIACKMISGQRNSEENYVG